MFKSHYHQTPSHCHGLFGSSTYRAKVLLGKTYFDELLRMRPVRVESEHSGTNSTEKSCRWLEKQTFSHYLHECWNGPKIFVRFVGWRFLHQPHGVCTHSASMDGLLPRVWWLRDVLVHLCGKTYHDHVGLINHLKYSADCYWKLRQADMCVEPQPAFNSRMELDGRTDSQMMSWFFVYKDLWHRTLAQMRSCPPRTSKICWITGQWSSESGAIHLKPPLK